MPTPLSATHRIEVQYQISSLPHKHRFYVLDDGTGSTVPGIIQRDASTISWVLAAQATMDVMKNFLVHSTVQSFNALYQVRAGSVWNTLDSYDNFGTWVDAGTFSTASELTFVMKDTMGNKVRANFLEGNAGYVGHSANGTGISAGITAMAGEYGSSFAGTHAPYMYVVGRSNLYLFHTQPIVGATLDLNDKVKRSRHLT